MRSFLKLSILSQVIFLFCAATFSFSAPTIIRFAHVVPESTPKGQMALEFKRLVDEKLKDRFVVEVYPNGTLLNDAYLLEGLLLDDIQIASPVMSRFVKYSKKMMLFDLPFLFQDMNAVNQFQQSAEGQELLRSFKKRGIIGLGYLHNGMKQLSATKKLCLPNDIAGLKINIPPSEVLEAQYSLLKAEGVGGSFDKLYDRLAVGIVDGQENPWSNVYAKKLYTVQPFFTESNHGVLDYLVVTSSNFWESLSEKDQHDLNEVIQEAIAYGNSLASKKASEARQNIINEKTCEIITLTPEQRKQWVDALSPIWGRFEKEIGRDLINAAIKSNGSVSQ